jgi:hypothetical protein
MPHLKGFSALCSLVPGAGNLRLQQGYRADGAVQALLQRGGGGPVGTRRRTLCLQQRLRPLQFCLLLSCLHSDGKLGDDCQARKTCVSLTHQLESSQMACGTWHKDAGTRHLGAAETTCAWAAASLAVIAAVPSCARSDACCSCAT